MNNFEKLKELLKDLSSEEIEQVKALLNEEEEEDSTNAEPASEPETTEEVDQKPTAEEEPKSETPEESAPVEEPEAKTVEETAPAEETATETEEAEPATNEGISESAIEEPKEEPSNVDDEIPSMVKGEERPEEECERPASNEQVTTENGKTLPVDYEQVVEGLNAKIAALEAENASLKCKVDGAFGYSAKPTIQTKVNRLYDDASDVHFHK